MRQSTKPKCSRPIKAYHVESGKVRWLPCRQRLCPECGPHRWRPSKLAALHAGLKQGDYLALLLTAPGDASRAWNEGAAKRWHVFFGRMRRRYPGARLDFWKVGELQERGLVHYHVVLRGLRWLSIEDFRADAVAAGFGDWVGVKRPRDYPGGVHSLGWYFGKYLLKDYRGHAVGRLVTMSLGWKVVWERRVREGPGRWMVIFRSWSSLGYEVVDRPPKPKAWRPSWWEQPWQWVRDREERPIAMGL